MSPNGRRAWRRAAKKLRRKLGLRWRSQKEWLHGKRWSELVPDLASHRGHISGPWFKRHGFQSLDQESSSRHYIGLSGTVDGDTIGFVEAARSFTARSLVGMSMGARKRIAWREYLAWCRKNPDRELLKSATIDTWDEKGLEEGYQRGLQAQREVRTKHRIGERLRPCPGCPQCTDDPLRIVRALSRRMKIRVEIRRCNSAIIPNKFDYLAMLHRPGPNWNPVCGFGPMRHDAVRALCDVILREGAEEFPIVSCDCSGVLPAHRP